MRLYVLTNFNNYFNRKIIRYEDLSDYLRWGDYSTYNVNFNPGDGLMTTHTLGSVVAYDGKGDYLVVTDEQNIIDSRWFILENHYVRGGQHELVLRRDVVADYYDETIAATCLVEKGIISNALDTAIYNREGNTYNQIKKRETLLKDKSQVPWLAVYYTRTTLENSQVTIRGYLNTPYSYADISVSSLENWDEYSYVEEGYHIYNQFQLSLFSHVGTSSSLNKNKYNAIMYRSSPAVDTSDAETEVGGGGSSYFTTPSSNTTSRAVWGALVNQNKNTLFAQCEDFCGWADGGEARARMEELENKILYAVEEDKFYRIKLNVYSGYTDNESRLFYGTRALTSSLIETGEAMGLSVGGVYVAENYPSTFALTGKYSIYRLSLIEAAIQPSDTNPAVSFAAANVQATTDAPYNVFCMPYGEIQIGSVTTNREDSLNIVSDIIQHYSGGSNPIVLDAQILPVCPVPNLVSEEGRISLVRIPEDAYTAAYDDEGIIGYVFHCPFSQFSTTLDYSIPLDIYDSIEFKVAAEAQFCRLVSPNWNGVFEFSPARNQGVSRFVVDCALKPYLPYIHCAPDFGGLYGARENDAIGLICGGDFSLTMVSDAFAAYERTNVNYERIFNRQIQNMEKMYELQTPGAILGAVTGTITGTTSGVATGAMLGGGGVGAAVGGVVGGISSGVGGVADLANRSAIHRESLSFAKDSFKYQVGSIAALPNSITKVSSFNPNNPLFIILEYYDCSEEEKEALRQQIKYTGMTIGRIDTLGNYVAPTPQYIQGKLIRIDGVPDAHMVGALAQEINQGIYIQRGEGYNDE